MEVENVNIKKLFPEKKITKKGLMEFLDKKGFYIVLVLCIAVIAFTVIFLSSPNISSSNPDIGMDNIIPEDIEGDIVTDVEDETVEDPVAANPIDTPAVMPEQKTPVNEQTVSADEQKVAVNEKTDEKSNKEESSNDKKPDDKTDNKSGSVTKNEQPKSNNVSSESTAASKKDIEFAMPVFGDVTFDYARDKLVYSKTLEEWRTHGGIDLAAERGTTVKAVADGVITEVKKDPGFGYTIVIDHQNGIKTVYSNLASDDMVCPNQKVKQGDIIGCVGNTALFESAEQSHLHFEVLKDNEQVNPNDYLPKKK